MVPTRDDARRLRPMLATPAAALPEGLLWSYEVKWDGYRALAIKHGSRVQLLSRNQKDLTDDYPGVVAASNTIRSPDVVFDGEIVAVDEAGRLAFQALQHRMTAGITVVYYAFDVLSVGKELLLSQPLAARQQRLRLLTLGSGVLLSEPLPGSPDRIEREVRRLASESAPGGAPREQIEGVLNWESSSTLAGRTEATCPDRVSVRCYFR